MERTDDPAMSTFEFIRNSLALVIIAVLLYYIAQVAVRIGNWRASRLLAPFAPLIGATPNSRNGFLTGNYQGHKIILDMSPKTSVGQGESATHINAFMVKVLDQPGEKDWWLTFHVTGLLGQGPRRLAVSARTDELAERLRASGIIDDVEQVSAPTQTYTTVAYDSFQKRLTYTDDVSPRKLPPQEHVQRYLELATRLAAVNKIVNAPAAKRAG
jgi:hypothetical protein